MNRWTLVLGALSFGCAQTQDFPEQDMAPFKAVVVFHDGTEAPSEPTAEGDGSTAEEEAPTALSQAWMEKEILRGLTEYRVFSDFIRADWQTMYDVAEKERADLLVLIRLGQIAQWESNGTRIVPELALLDGVLWFTTAVGGWFIPDREFQTESDVEVAWKRPVPAGESPGDRGPRTLEELQAEFRFRERISSADYRLSMWERAKPWSYPGAYLVDLVVPPALVPLQDDEEVNRSLKLEALEDIKRQMAETLRASNVRSGRSPFYFRLEEPKNGETVDRGAIRLRFRYQLEHGYENEKHEEFWLAALRMELKRAGRADYETLREYKGELIRRINDSIARDALIEEEIEILEPGVHLIRFSALTEYRPHWITNTIALIIE